MASHNIFSPLRADRSVEHTTDYYPYLVMFQACYKYKTMTLPVQSADDTQRYVGIAVITGVIVLVTFNLLETLLRPSWLKKVTDAKRTYFYTWYEF